MGKGEELQPWGDPKENPVLPHGLQRGGWAVIFALLLTMSPKHTLGNQPAGSYPYSLQSCIRENPAVPIWAGADGWPSLSTALLSLISWWVIAGSGKWFTLCTTPSAGEAHPLLYWREKYSCWAQKIINWSNYWHNKKLKVRIVVVKEVYSSFFPVVKEEFEAEV